MRNGIRWMATAAVAGALCLAAPAAAGKGGNKPPSGGSADPELTFVEAGHVQVANRDGSNKTTVYLNRKAYLYGPKMSADHRSVLFREAYSTIRRTEFSVVNGRIVVGDTETLFESDPGPDDFALHPLRSDGTMLALLFGEGIYELDTAVDCPGRPCGPADLGEALFQSSGCLYGRLGEYTPNGRALYFQEALDPETCLPVNLMRLEFGTEPGVPPAVGLVYSDLANRSRELDASPIDYGSNPYGYGPFETRLLFNVTTPEPYVAELWTLDTWSGEASPLLDGSASPLIGHYASWSPDESAVIFVRRWQNAANWVSGRVITHDLASGVETQIDDFSLDPDWAPRW